MTALASSPPAAARTSAMLTPRGNSYTPGRVTSPEMLSSFGPVDRSVPMAANQSAPLARIAAAQAKVSTLFTVVGAPRNRPPFPVITGLRGAPTTVNNVETFAWAAAILAKGAEWFAAIGTDRSTGPKLLSISGDVTRPGVYEFPLGVSIAEVLAAAGSEDARAVIVGGAAGTCVRRGRSPVRSATRT